MSVAVEAITKVHEKQVEAVTKSQDVVAGVLDKVGAAVDQLPGGASWRAAVERVPERMRHLHVHEGHCVAVPERERSLLDPGLGAMTFSGTAAELQGRPA